MKSRPAVGALFVLCLASGLLATINASAFAANLSLELIGSPQITVMPSEPFGADELFPISGEGRTIWGRVTNRGSETFEGIFQGAGSIQSGANLFIYPFATVAWDPFWDPQPPLVRVPGSACGLRLESNESYDFLLMEAWGVEIGSSPTLRAAPVGSVLAMVDYNLYFLEGLVHPDPHGIPPDVRLELDRPFTITVVPEPTLLAFGILAAFLAASRRRTV